MLAGIRRQSRNNSGYVHFDVLGRVDTVAPPVKREAESQSVNRDTMSWHEVEVGQYSRQVVCERPHGQRDQVSIAASSSGIEYTYAAVVKNHSPKASPRPDAHSLSHIRMNKNVIRFVVTTCSRSTVWCVPGHLTLSEGLGST